jgi:acetyltransferase
MFCHPIPTGIGEVMVRPIGPGDADMAQGFVGSLSATSRYFRFFQSLKGLSPGMLERFTRIDHPTHLALVGIALVAGQQRIVGEARYAVNDDGVSADIAVAVADAWQRRGVATGLLDMLERIAAATGVTRLTGESFAVNDTFLSFARAFGFKVRPDAADRSFLRIEKQIGERTFIRLGGTRDPGG